MDQQERHYNINKLNVIFALSSVALLASLIWMVNDDYSRQWKEYQKKFQNLEVEKTRVRYDAAAIALEAQQEYVDLAAAIEKAESGFSATCPNFDQIAEQIRTEKAKNDLVTHEYKIAKAELDAAKFAYEDTHHKNKPSDSITKKYNDYVKKVAALKLQVEQSDLNLDKKISEKEQCEEILTDLKKQKATLAKEKELIERKLKKLDPNEMSFGNLAASAVRDIPILDLANPSYKIEQIVLKDLKDDVKFLHVPKVDRCITCHKGIDDPAYIDAPQPFTTHPNLELYLSKNSAHPVEEFGCTVCHGGRGRGTDFVSTAHTPSTKEEEHRWHEKYNWHEMHHWDTPMYPKQYIQAGCFKCHSDENVIKGADKLNLGLNLMEKAGCYSCHLIDKYKNWSKPGPDLTHISSKVTKDWTYRWIEDPKSFRHSAWMPSFFNQDNNSDQDSKVKTEQEIHAMVHYLFKNSKDFKQDGIPTAGDPIKGKEVVASVGCFGCHNVQKSPTNKPITIAELQRQQGPNLIGLGSKVDKKWIYNWLKDPNRYHPETRMPNLRLTNQEAADAAAYLIQDTNPDFTRKPIPPVNESVLNNIVKSFLMKSETEAQAITKINAMKLNEKLEFTGKKVIAHYGCYSCHTISGFEDYKPIGTELTYEGSKATNKFDFGFAHIPHTKSAWFTQKLKNPRIFDQGKVKEHYDKLRMPDYNFTDQEIEAIVTAILGFVDDKIDHTKLKPKTVKNEYLAKGRKIIKEFNCQGCHIIEGTGGAIQPNVIDWMVEYQEKGESEAKALVTSFSPPNLIGEGSKVQADWLFKFLHNPTTIRPWLDVRMPTYNFNVEHLNAIVKYFNALDDQEFPFTDVGDIKMSAEHYEAGKKLFSKDYFACAQCHIVGSTMPSGSPANWAPDFGLASKRLKPKWLKEWIKNPQDLLPGTKMPSFYDPEYFDESGPEDILEGDEALQIEMLANYILTLSGPQQEETAPSTPEPTPTQP